MKNYPPPHSVWVQLWSDTLGCPVLPQPKLTTQNNLLHLSWASGSPIYMKHIQRGFTQGVAPQKPSSSAVLLVLWVSYSFFFFNWSIVSLQHCVSFRYTAKWFSYTYISTPFQILFHYRLLQDTEYSFCFLFLFLSSEPSLDQWGMEPGEWAVLPTPNL